MAGSGSGPPRSGGDPLRLADADGVLRGKTLVAEEALRVLRNGVNVTTMMLLKGLSGRTAFGLFRVRRLDLREMQGAAEMVLVPTR